MRFTRGLFLCLAMTLGAFPQMRPRRLGPPDRVGVTPQAQQEQEAVKPEDQCTVEGTVVNAKTGEPLRKVQIMLRGSATPGRPLGAVTDAAGKFKLTAVNPGRYRISVSRNGYTQEEARGGSDRSPTVLTLLPGQTLRNLDFRMLPAAVVTGRVLDEEGEPFVRVAVQASRYRYHEGRRQLVPAGNATTDDLGRYRIFGLSPGRYYVTATYNDFRGRFIEQAGDDEEYAPVFYPGTNDAAQAVALDLQAGEERAGIDFNLAPAQTVRVRGRIVNAPADSGRRRTTVSLFASPSTGFRSGRSSSRVGKDGAFEIRGVIPGSYVLMAFANVDGQRLSARRSISVGASDADGIELALRPGVELHGRVHVESDPGTAVELNGLVVALRPQDDSMIFGGPPSASVQEDGSFVLKNVTSGNYQLDLIREPAGTYLRAAKLGSMDILANGLSMDDGSSGGPLELVLSAAGGKLDGTVKDGDQQPVSGATVVLVPEPKQRNRSDLYKTATTDQNGRFSVLGIPPGEYAAFAWDGAEQGAWQDPDFLRLYEDKGSKVSVEEKSQQTVELSVLQAQNDSE